MNENQKTILACHNLLINGAKNEKRRRFYTEKRDAWLADLKRRQYKPTTPSFIDRYVETLPQ